MLTPCGALNLASVPGLLWRTPTSRRPLHFPAPKTDPPVPLPQPGRLHFPAPNMRPWGLIWSNRPSGIETQGKAKMKRNGSPWVRSSSPVASSPRPDPQRETEWADVFTRTWGEIVREIPRTEAPRRKYRRGNNFYSKYSMLRSCALVEAPSCHLPLVRAAPVSHTSIHRVSIFYEYTRLVIQTPCPCLSQNNI